MIKTKSRLSRFFTNSPQSFPCADHQGVHSNGWGGVAGIAQPVAAQQFEIGTIHQNVANTLLIENEDMAIHMDKGSMVSFSHPLSPEFLACFGIKTPGKTIVGHSIDSGSNRYGGAGVQRVAVFAPKHPVIACLC